MNEYLNEEIEDEVLGDAVLLGRVDLNAMMLGVEESNNSTEATKDY
jgi:hypothetical protein